MKFAKLATSFFTIDNQFFDYILVLIAIYIAQTLFKISSTRQKGEFDWKKLINGTIDYAIYFAGIIVFFFGGTIIPNVKILEVNGQSYSIPDALTLFALALIVIQSTKAFKNIKETFEVKDEDLNVNDKEASFRG